MYLYQQQGESSLSLWSWCLVLSHVQFFETPWTVAHQAPLSMGILQARTLDWVAMPSSRGSFQPRDQLQVSCIAGRFFTIWAIREDLELAPHLRLHPVTFQWIMILLTNAYQKYDKYFYGPFCWTRALSKCKYIWLSFFIWDYANT